MKFIEQFAAARKVSTPGVVVRTPDAASTIANVKKAITLGMNKDHAQKTIDETPLISWDVIHGFGALNKKATTEIASMCQKAKTDVAASTALPIALAIAENASPDCILFIHNAHLFWDITRGGEMVIQAIWNLRDKFKANGIMLVLMTSLGTTVPAELSNDLLLMEEPLPTRAEIKEIVKAIYVGAGLQDSKGKTIMPTEETLTLASDALVGIAAFPSDQATAMHLNTDDGSLDIKGMWGRKKDIISTTSGLTFFDGLLKLKDAGGLANIKKYLTRIMKGKRGANIILRLDEIEKAFAGAQTDSSGVKGDLLGNFLSWVEDKKVICILFVGVPGASKSHIIYCIGGEFGKPVLNFDISGMQDMHVGNSGKNLRNAEATVEAISDGQIILLATANSLNGLPAELISRFERGGIFFFDAPTPEEREEILKIKIAQYKLTPAQCAVVPDMTDWTGREIDSMCNNADMLTDETKGEICTLVDAGKYVVPLIKSHSVQMTELRQSAHNRFLSASQEGLYQYTGPTDKEKSGKPANGTVHQPVVETTAGRRIRRNETDKSFDA